MGEQGFDYYYGDESGQFSFYRIPRQLITGARFKRLSTDAKLLQGYSVLRTPPAREEVTVSDLLDCLDEADMEVSPPPEQAVPSGGEVQPETPVQAPPELAAGPPPSERKQKPPPAKPAPAAKKKGPLKKRPALVR